MELLPYHIQKNIFNYLNDQNKLKLIKTNLLDKQMTQFYLINKCDQLQNIVNSTLLIKHDGQLADYLLRYIDDIYDFKCSICGFLQYEIDSKKMGCRKHLICDDCEKQVIKTKCMECAHVELSLDRRFIRMVNGCKGEYIKCLHNECINMKHYCPRCELLQVMKK